MRRLTQIIPALFSNVGCGKQTIRKQSRPVDQKRSIWLATKTCRKHQNTSLQRPVLRQTLYDCTIDRPICPVPRRPPKRSHTKVSVISARMWKLTNAAQMAFKWLKMQVNRIKEKIKKTLEKRSRALSQ